MDIKKFVDGLIGLTQDEGITVTEEQAQRIKREVDKKVTEEASKPLVVSIMGQTGVGKSSLINALFNTKLKTDSVRPCTKTIERVINKGASGHELWFYDLPGIGESDKADAEYLHQYKKQLMNSDVVLWALHADSRSVSFDVNVLRTLLKSFDKPQQVQLMSKLTFVLTKADLVTPTPWILAKLDNYGSFVPGKATKGLLEQKAAYYQEEFIKPYADLMISETYNDEGFDVSVPPLSYDKYTVRFRGIMDEKTLTSLKTKYPRYSAVFDRLYDNYQVIPCSSLFRFNLAKLMLVIVNKLGPTAVSRFQKFYSDEMLSKVPMADAKKYCNLIVFDPKKNRKLFDLTEVQL